jgi:hypothetical protein
VKLFHPSPRRLLIWADGTKTRWTIRHVDRCARCSDRLDRLTALDSQALRSLQEALAPPDGFRGKTERELQTRVRNGDTLLLLGELFGIGWTTTLTLLEEEDHE